MRKVRNIIAAIFACCLISLGFVKRAKKSAFEKGNITALYFHNPTRKLFEKCIKWLRKNRFIFISTDELFIFLNKKIPPPRGAVWITFDDGWKDNMENIIPVAIAQNIPIIIFISTGPVEGNGIFWWTYAKKYSRDLPILYKKDLNLLWKIPETERKQVLDVLIAKHKNDLSREAITIDDVKRFANIPQVTLGSHTVNHVITPNCTIEELDKEIGDSKSKLEIWSGKEIKYFTFPNGDVNGKEIEILKKYNFVLSATAENRLINTFDDLYRLPRFEVSNGMIVEEICHMMGVWKPIISKIKSLFYL